MRKFLIVYNPKFINNKQLEEFIEKSDTDRELYACIPHHKEDWTPLYIIDLNNIKGNN